MATEKSRFGFIDYYVYGALTKVPAEFYDTATGLMAWIDSERIEKRMSVRITADMKPMVIGGFAQVMETYRAESQALFNNVRLWKECIQNGAGLLLLFSAMHRMRASRMNADEAIESSILATIALRESENAVVGEIAGMFADAGFFSAPEKVIGVNPGRARLNEHLFSLT